MTLKDRAGQKLAKLYLITSAATCLFLFSNQACFCKDAQRGHDFVYNIQSVVPIPPSEQSIQTIEAKPAAVAGNNGQTLEGAMFGPDDNLLFCNVSDGKVMRLSPDGSQSVVLEISEFAPGGLA